MLGIREESLFGTAALRLIAEELLQVEHAVVGDGDEPRLAAGERADGHVGIGAVERHMMDRVLQKRPQLRPAFRRQPAQIAHRRVAAVVGGVGVPGMTEIAEGDVERRRAFEEWPGHGGGGVGDHAAAATGEGFEPFHCRRGDGLVLPEHEHGVEALRQRRRAGEHFLGDEHRRQADVGERVEHLERAVGVGLRVGCHGDLPLRVKQADSWTRGGFRQQPAELLHEATAERRLLALRAVGFEHLAAAISIGERRAHLEGVAGALGA